MEEKNPSNGRIIIEKDVKLIMRDPQSPWKLVVQWRFSEVLRKDV